MYVIKITEKKSLHSVHLPIQKESMLEFTYSKNNVKIVENTINNRYTD